MQQEANQLYSGIFSFNNQKQHCIQSMLENSWSNKLAQEPKMATIADLPMPTVLYQTHANTLMAHSRAESTPLPIRKDILGMCSLSGAQVCLLTRYQLSCFDLLNNNQVFNLEFENAQALYVDMGFIYVICGCDIFCYNQQGEEQYVNHSSSPIQALTSVNIKGAIEVIIGLNDLGMTRYKGVNISYDYGKAAGTPSSICWIGEGVLVGTKEGIVAYYETKKSKWKAKSHHPVLKVLAYRTESTYLAIIGRKDGLVQLKDWQGKGQTIFKIKLQQELINLLVHDYRQQNNEQLICISKSGKITGLNMYEQEKKVEKKQVADEVKLEMQSIQALQNQKLNLQFQVNELEKRIAEAGNIVEEQEREQILDQNFNFQTYLHHKELGLALNIECINGYISGLTFEEPILPVTIDRAQAILYYFKAENIVYGQINCNLLVHSSYTSKMYEARGFKITLLKFWKFGFIQTEFKDKIQGGIRFTCVQRNARYIKWITQCFFMKWTDEQKNKYEQAHTMKLKYYNAYDKVALQFNFTPKQSKVEIHCDCIKTLGLVFQDLVQYLGVKQLDSQLWFPKDKSKLIDTIQVIERLSQAKVSISSQMAQAIDNIKFMLVKGESARCVGAMGQLRKTYTQIMEFNRNLLTQIQKKNKNTKQLSESLKTLGLIINQTANVRYGKAKEMMISGCRQAIKKREFPKIVAIMERGASAL